MFEFGNVTKLHYIIKRCHPDREPQWLSKDWRYTGQLQRAKTFKDRETAEEEVEKRHFYVKPSEEAEEEYEIHPLTITYRT